MTGEHVSIYYLWDWIIQDQSGTMHHMLTNLAYVGACMHHCLWPNGPGNTFNRWLFCAERQDDNDERHTHAARWVCCLTCFQPSSASSITNAYWEPLPLLGEGVGSGPTIKKGQVIRFHFLWSGWAHSPFPLFVFFSPSLLLPRSPVWLVYRIKSTRGREGSHLRTDVERESERDRWRLHKPAQQIEQEMKCKETRRRGGEERKVSTHSDGREGRWLELKIWTHYKKMTCQIHPPLLINLLLLFWHHLVPVPTRAFRLWDTVLVTGVTIIDSFERE